MLTYTIIQGSYLPGLRFFLRDAAGHAISLAGVTSARLVAADRFAAEEASLLVNKELSVSGSPNAGILSGTWASSETHIKPGSYKAQIEVTYASEEEVAKFGPLTFVVAPSVTR